jgi:hypothetical protein
LGLHMGRYGQHGLSRMTDGGLFWEETNEKHDEDGPRMHFRTGFLDVMDLAEFVKVEVEK